MNEQKIRLHIDQKNFDGKPTGNEIGAMKTRIQKNIKAGKITIVQLVEKITAGHAISPAVMNGTTSSDWVEQQLFLLDIDNDADEITARKNGCTVNELNESDLTPILMPREALAICEDAGIKPAFYYYTYSHKKEKPKYRLAFVIEDVITHSGKRKVIMEVLTSLLKQSDKACQNADRIFLGTNKKAVVLDIDARVSLRQIRKIREEQKQGFRGTVRVKDETELERLKQEFDFLEFLKERNGECKPTGNTVTFKNCEICGHHDDLVYYKETNSFYCYSKSGDVGGSIIDYLMLAERISLPAAIEKFKYELCNLRDAEWEHPNPLQSYNLPDFPIECLPSRIRNFVSAVAVNTYTVVDMAAMASLAVLATTLQGKFEIEGKPGHVEPLSLYVLIIAESGELKSPILRALTRVISEYEETENAKREQEILEQQTILSVKQHKIEKLEKLGKEEEAISLKKERRALEKNMTKELDIVADDITSEQLNTLLAQQGALSIISTEGGIFDTLLGRYSNGSITIDTLLKAYSGDPIKVNRVSRAKEYIEKPCLTILLSAQPQVLENIMNQKELKGRGLISRFLYCNPKSLIGTREYITPSIPLEAKKKYEQLIVDLFAIPKLKSKPSLLKLDEGALSKLADFYSWVEKRLKTKLFHIQDWSKKVAGTALRIAGLLHCVKYQERAAENLVSKEVMQKAILMSQYFIKQAKYSYSLAGLDRQVSEAQIILNRLEQQKQDRLGPYQIFKLCRKHPFKKTEDVLPALKLLVEYGYLKCIKDTTPTGGRVKGNIYVLNPLHFDLD